VTGFELEGVSSAEDNADGGPRCSESGSGGVSEIRLRVDAAEDAGLDQRVGDRGDHGAADRPRAVACSVHAPVTQRELPGTVCVRYH
jgi:hypothetical protein